MLTIKLLLWFFLEILNPDRRVREGPFSDAIWIIIYINKIESSVRRSSLNHLPIDGSATAWIIYCIVRVIRGRGEVQGLGRGLVGWGTTQRIKFLKPPEIKWVFSIFFIYFRYINSIIISSIVFMYLIHYCEV